MRRNLWLAVLMAVTFPLSAVAGDAVSGGAAIGASFEIGAPAPAGGATLAPTTLALATPFVGGVTYRPRHYRSQARVMPVTTQLHAGFFDPGEDLDAGFDCGFRIGPQVDPHVQIGVAMDWWHRSENQEIEPWAPTTGRAASSSRGSSCRESTLDLVPLLAFVQVSGDENMPVIPYAGVGVGYEWLFLTADDYLTRESYEQTFGGFGWQVWGGLGIPLSGRTRLNGEVFYNACEAGSDVDVYLADYGLVTVRDIVNMNGVGRAVRPRLGLLEHLRKLRRPPGPPRERVRPGGSFVARLLPRRAAPDSLAAPCRASRRVPAAASPSRACRARAARAPRRGASAPARARRRAASPSTGPASRRTCRAARDRRGRRRWPPAPRPSPPILERLYPDAATPLVHANALQLLVATILSAQCTDARVNLVTPELFARFPDAAALAGAGRAALEELIRSTGFYRNKAKAIQACCAAIVADHGGAVPRTMAELVVLPGVGRKTANVVLGSAYGIPGIVVDTHVQRLAGRLGFTTERDPVKIEFALQPLVPREKWSRFSLWLVFHGRRVCVARKPRCSICPLAPHCPRLGVTSAQ